MKTIGMFILGMVVTMLCFTTYLSINYGRMREHKTCDRSVYVQDLEDASNKYYSSLHEDDDNK